MSALGELRKLDDTVRREVLPTDSEDVIAARCRALLQLGDLSHLLRPAFEALEKLTMLDMEGGEEMLHAVGGGMAVLASLEEAMK